MIKIDTSFSIDFDPPKSNATIHLTLKMHLDL